MPTPTNTFARMRLLLSLASSAGLVACASGPDVATGVVARTPPPQEAEKTVNNFFAFKLPGPQKNTNIVVGPPEAGDCSLGFASSMRGWVVPVAYRTYSGELGGKQTIQINEKQYWFWFHGNHIAGITRRADHCPGLGSVFGDSEPPANAAAAGAARPVPVALQAPKPPEAAAEVKAVKPARPARGKAGPSARPGKGTTTP